MLTRTALAALAAALVLSASPGAFAAKGKQRTTVKPLERGAAGAGAGTRTRARVQPLHGTMGRAPRGSTVAARNAAVEQVEEIAPAGRASRRSARSQRSFHLTPKPSIGKNLGWGTFFGTLAAASLVTGGTSAVGGLVIFGAAAGYNFVKAYLNNRRSTTAEQSRDIAFNAGWGTFWTGLGLHGLASGDVFSAAIGIGAGVYNAYKVHRNAREIPAE